MSDQAVLVDGNSPLGFDDINTIFGWGDISKPYHDLVFEGFYPFRPSHPRFERLISEHDLNCAVSKPNALHGSRYNIDPDSASTAMDEEPTKLPSIRPQSDEATFNVKALKIKPLNFPINTVTVSMRGTRSLKVINSSQGSLLWTVDFPAGYHEVLNVSLWDFTHQEWDNLSRLELWADFNNAGETMDWEFCIDDLEVELHGA